MMMNKFIILYVLIQFIFLTDASNAKPILRVSSINYEPFMYQRNNGEFYKGIEYNLLKTLANELNVTLSITKWKFLNFTEALHGLHNK